MAKTAFIKIHGVNETIAKLRKFSKDFDQDVIDAVEDAATNIEIKATRNRPNFVRIDKIIKNKGFTATVGVQGDDKLAVYFEFGTGLSAVAILAGYPQDVKDLAMQYYINGQGTLTGKPYLFPPFFEEQPKFIQELAAIVQRANNTTL